MPPEAAVAARTTASRPRARRSAAGRLVFVLPAAAALVVGLWSALARLAVPVPDTPLSIHLAHGALMVSGFLGTLVSLERAVASGRRPAYAAPVLTGLGAIAVIADEPIGPALILAGSVALGTIYAVVLAREPVLHVAAQATGGACWVAGNAFWAAGWPVSLVVHWWAGFLVLTIAGERLELGRLVRLSTARRVLFGVVTVGLVAALAARSVAWQTGTRAVAVGFGALGAWLLASDVAWRTIRTPGLPRFAAASILLGHAWLVVSAPLLWRGAGALLGVDYDAAIHAVFLGFAFSMIFGHAPVIFPAVSGVPVPYRRAFWLHLAVLHLSLAARIAGDLLPSFEARRLGSLGNVAAVLLFLAATVGSAAGGRTRPTPRAGTAP